MIASFGDKATEDLYHGLRTKRVRRIPSRIWQIAYRKLDMIQYAQVLQDLRVPPGNRLEALKGDLHGYHSIRVNEQWRIVFRWQEGLAYDVSIVDYHSG
ncbi:MAG TPA: type II toxin-antitoxin system RelE/ParE family toxin [Candidatus Hydrogenedentes bacterium]|nr:type II toxin-antitoxin system RelE/ParE family toxin [Candidatus Hydrogenedentota bacterium]